MNCKNLTDGVCTVASSLAKQLVRPDASACKYCSDQCDPAQGLNRVTVSIALSALPKDSPAVKTILAEHGPLLQADSKPPTWAQEAWSVTKAVAALVADGGRLVDSQTYQQRLSLCDACPNRSGHRCKICGCFVRVKARLPNERCPMNPPLWDATRGLTPARSPTPLILQTGLCPGDLLTLTAAVHSLHTTYPGEYETDVRTKHPAIWTANPHVTPIPDGDKTARVIDMHYPSVHRCNQESVPFLAGYTEHIGEQLGRPLRLRTNRPQLYLTPEESSRPRAKLWPGAPNLEKPFWIVNAGIKRDFTTKSWPLEYYQEVIDRTKDRVTWVQIGLKKDMHRGLRNVINLVDVGGPPMRETILLARHAAGGLGPVTFLQHLMAAWQKPYFCLVGGREPTTWVTYPYQQTFHTVGQLECCRPFSCWKSRTVPLNDGNEKDKNLCRYPVTDLERPSPKCMVMIQPAEVLTMLERYL